MSDTIIKKPCIHCQIIKPLFEFHKHSKMKDGHINKCKDCVCEYVRKWGKTKAGRLSDNKYRHSEKGKISRRRYNMSVKKKAARIRHSKRYYPTHRTEAKARIQIMMAVRAKRIPRPDTLLCIRCNGNAKEYHHPDYSKPLDVVPMCTKCHNFFHSK